MILFNITYVYIYLWKMEQFSFFIKKKQSKELKIVEFMNVVGYKCI